MKGLIVHRKKKTENGDNDNNQNIYAYMVQMSVNDKSFTKSKNDKFK